MRNIIPSLLILLSSIIFSCSEEEFASTELLGTYRLTAAYVDPGDGSGTFQPVESNRRITLKGDNTYTTNYNFCNTFRTEADTLMSGKYNLEEKFLIAPDICSGTFYSDTLQIELKSKELIIHYICIEGCAEKFTQE